VQKKINYYNLDTISGGIKEFNRWWFGRA